MEFRRFESAVRRHGSGKYTMCDFLNLIKAAARDISDEYETDVYELARGDESQFADLISNQCFMISEMMDASGSGGSDDRLERLNEEIKELKGRADSLAESMKDIESLKQQKEALDTELKQLEEQKLEYDNIRNDISSVESSIKQAGEFDIDAAKNRLEGMKKELEEKQNSNSRMLKQTEELKKSISELEEKNNSLGEENKKLEELNASVKSRYEEVCRASGILKGDRSKWESQFSELYENRDVLMQKSADSLENDYTELCAQYNMFYESMIKPRINEINELNAKISNKENEYQAQYNENERLKNELNEVTEKLENMRGSNIILEANISSTQASVEPIEQQWNEYNSRYTEMLAKLAKLNRRINELENNDIPKAEGLLKNAEAVMSSKEKTVDEKAEKLSGLLYTEYREINRIMTEMNETLRSKEDELRAAQKNYNETADKISSYDTKIKELREKADSLEMQNEDAKKDKITEQLNSRIQSLTEEAEKTAKEKEKLEAEIKELEEKQKDEKASHSELVKRKNELEKAEAELSGKIALLKVYASDDRQKKLDSIKSKLSVIVPVIEKVENMMRNIGNITGGKYVSRDQTEQAGQYKRALNDILKEIPEIQKEISDSVNSVSDKMILKEQI